jgi:hypothetical protein
MSHSIVWGYVNPQAATCPQHAIGASPTRGFGAAQRMLGLGWSDEPRRLWDHRPQSSAGNRTWDWTDDLGASAGLAVSQRSNPSGSADRSSVSQSRMYQRSPPGSCYSKRERAARRCSRAIGFAHASNARPRARGLQDTLRARPRVVAKQLLYRPQRVSYLPRMSARSVQDLEATQQVQERP